MMRVLQFEGTEEGRTRFELLFQGFLSGGSRTPGESKGIEVVRREARILDKFEAISDGPPEGAVLPAGLTAAMSRSLKEEGGSITLDSVEYDLLRRYVEGCNWMPGVSKKVVEVVDWLIDVPKT